MNLCIIPARSGSKRIKNKNIKLLCGKPLIDYTIEAALEAKIFDKIVLSSDSSEILEFGKKFEIDIDLRPNLLANDTVTTIEVALDYIQRTGIKDCYETITILLPTCPFRTGIHISEAFNLMRSNNSYSFLVSVAEYEFPIQYALEPINDKLARVLSVDNYMVKRTQDFEKRIHPNGAIYIAKMKDFLQNETFFNGEFLYYKMNQIDSFDIDYPEQFELAELFFQVRKLMKR